MGKPIQSNNPTTMIKRILVALDADSDTPTAIRYAADIASRYDALVVGLAVVDTGTIDEETRGGGIGSMYYAEKLRANLTDETRQKAAELIQAFESSLEGTGVAHKETIAEGVPFHRIVEDMKYHDLLVIGREPHFFYGRPEQKTASLAYVVKETTGPTLIVGETYRPIRRVLIAHDGSDPSARALQYFVHLKPFGADVEIEVINIHTGDDSESTLRLELVASYLEAHDLSVSTRSLRGGDAGDVICDYARDTGADVVVAGARAASKLKKWAFGSTTSKLLNKCPGALFFNH